MNTDIYDYVRSLQHERYVYQDDENKNSPTDKPQDCTQERETGIEPATPSLARRCSTAEPLAHIVLYLPLL